MTGALMPLDIDALPIAVLRLDRTRAITAMNTKAEALLGVSRKTGQGKALDSILYHDCALFDLLDRIDRDIGHMSAKVTLNGPSVPSSRALTALVTLFADNSFAVCFVMHLAGETGEIETSGLAAFGRILGHEVKNPLAGVSGATQLLLRNARDDQRELLELILSESDRITRLVDKLSAFELFSAPRRAACNIHKALEQVMRSEEIAFGDCVNFVRNFDPSLPEVHADSDHLHEAMQNIIRNGAEAIRDSGTGSTVTVTTRFSLDGLTALVGKGDTSRSVKITICDNGPGINKNAHSKIFEIFQTSKPKGSGLGLTIASQIIHAHDGIIELDRATSQTCFTIHIPIARPS